MGRKKHIPPQRRRMKRKRARVAGGSFTVGRSSMGIG
jgi:hypothetical protein